MKKGDCSNPSWPPPAGHPKGELLSTGFTVISLASRRLEAGKACQRGDRAPDRNGPCQLDNLIARISRIEDNFPTAVSCLLSESVVRFLKSGLVYFFKICHAHIRFRWMAPNRKTAPLPGPPNPSHSINSNTKTKNFYHAPNFFYGDFSRLPTTRGREGLSGAIGFLTETGSANLTTLPPEFRKLKTTFQLQFLGGNLDLLSDF
jgi:hypothetical protein